MPPAGAIRQGGVYVEISADDAPLVRSLAASQARLRAWVAQNQAQFTKATEGALSGEAGGTRFLSGSFKGTELFEGGLKFAAAIGATKAAIADVQIFSALFRGDMEGARAAAEKLPFGLGEITKELGAAADEAAKFMLSLAGRDMAGAYDSAATAKAARDRAAQAKAWNEGLKIIEAQADAFRKATMSARDYFKAQLESKGIGQEQVDQALAIYDQTEAAKTAQRALTAERAEAAGQGSRDLEAREGVSREYARATLSARDMVAAEVEGMHLSAGVAKEVLEAKLRILDITEKQAAAEKAAKLAASITESLEALKIRVAEAKGDLDSLGAEQERAVDNIADAVGAGTLSFSEATAEIDKVKAAYGELRKAQDEATGRKVGQDLTEAMKTPLEKAAAEIARYKAMLAHGDIGEDTYSRAIRKSVEEAASSMPDAMRHTVGVRGTFNAMEAAGFGAGNVADRILAASEKTAKNTEKIAQAADALGVTFN